MGWLHGGDARALGYYDLFDASERELVVVGQKLRNGCLMVIILTA